MGTILGLVAAFGGMDAYQQAIKELALLSIQITPA